MRDDRLSEAFLAIGCAPYFLEGRIREIADYCETDVVNTYRVWLRYELFRGRLTESEYQASERNLADFIATRVNRMPRFAEGQRPEVRIAEAADVHRISAGASGAPSIDTWVADLLDKPEEKCTEFALRVGPASKFKHIPS
jgi:hypothetical protein